MPDSEKLIERRLASCIKERGGLCIKLLCDQFAGLPDRLCLLPNGRCAFVELKSTGKKPRKLQELVHEKIRSLGFRLEVIDTLSGLDDFIGGLDDVE